MKLARLNENGLRMFTEYLTRVRAGAVEPPPIGMLDDASFSDSNGLGICMPQRIPATRYELGEILVEILRSYDQPMVLRDAGIWAWLALYYFDCLCPAGTGGVRKVARQDNYIPSIRRNDLNRHAIRTPYLLVRLHGNLVQYMLSSPMSVRGEFTEQITGRPYFVNCVGIMEAAHALYADTDRGTYKRGAASKRSGTVRRFGLVVRQLELTYDVIDLDGRAIVALLPSEFDRFKA